MVTKRKPHAGQGLTVDPCVKTKLVFAVFPFAFQGQTVMIFTYINTGVLFRLADLDYLKIATSSSMY